MGSYIDGFFVIVILRVPSIYIGRQNSQDVPYLYLWHDLLLNPGFFL